MKKRLLVGLLILSTTMTGCGGCRSAADEAVQDTEVLVSTETEALRDIVADAQDTEGLVIKASETTEIVELEETESTEMMEKAEKTDKTETATKPTEVADNKTSTTDKSSSANTKPDNSNGNSSINDSNSSSSNKNESVQTSGSTDNGSNNNTGSNNDTGSSSSGSNTDVAAQPQPETPVEPEVPAEPVNPKNPNGYPEITWEQYLIYTSHDTWTPGSYYIVDTDQTVHIQEPIYMEEPEEKPWNPNGYPEITADDINSGNLAPGTYWVAVGEGSVYIVEPAPTEPEPTEPTP